MILFFIANIDGSKIASNPHESIFGISFIIKKFGGFD